MLQKVMQIKNYRKNDAIFTEGTIPNGIFYLKEGKVKNTRLIMTEESRLFISIMPGNFLDIQPS
ncbi:cyclic nucleotide-binding domain-containing protein [Chryseobacterium indoltheticum]|uniref:cyclic nucleotide-binding domain-containing protein n=1 Tax=Chryseobacterium indoltheticum TaxID=254 RepID=UPI003F491617